jgi:hypothetical protein
MASLNVMRMGSLMPALSEGVACRTVGGVVSGAGPVGRDFFEHPGSVKTAQLITASTQAKRAVRGDHIAFHSGPLRPRPGV